MGGGGRKVGNKIEIKASSTTLLYHRACGGTTFRIGVCTCQNSLPYNTNFGEGGMHPSADHALG